MSLSRLKKIFAIVLGLLVFSPSNLWSQTSIRFYGNGVAAPDQDRIKIQIDEVGNNNPGPPVDVGSEDFTIEFWMKAAASDNTAPTQSCGSNIDWIYGNIIIDRDRFNQDRKYGISIVGGKIIFGVSGDGTGDRTICSTTNVLDNVWHHIALQRRRSDGYLWLYIDGVLEAQADGPDGDISYPDNGTPCSDCCGGNCNGSDPYIVLGAEKHDAGAQYPSYNGHIDELRFSNVIRYSGNFTPSEAPFIPDGSTMGLYHFEDGMGSSQLMDASGAMGGPSHGAMHYGGTPQGPVWVSDSPLGCGTTPANTWISAQQGTWDANPDNWSLVLIPTKCHLVILPPDARVQIIENTQAAAKTLDVQLGAILDVGVGGILQVGDEMN